MFRKMFLTLFVLLLAASSGLGFFVATISLTEPISPVGFKHVNTTMWDQGYAAANGTWIMLNDKTAYPIQTSEIWCVKEKSTCHEALAKVSDGKYLSVELYPREITSWSDRAISFIDTSPTCVVYNYTFDRLVNQVTARRTAIQPKPAGCGDMRDNIEMVLGDGFTVWSQERDRRTPWTLIGFVEATIFLCTLYFVYRIWRGSKAPRERIQHSAA